MTLAEIKRLAAVNVFGEQAVAAVEKSGGGSHFGGGGGTVVDIDGACDPATIADFTKAMSRFQTDVGNSQAVAVRRATIQLVKHLRARTNKSKKMAPTGDVVRATDPRYLSTKGEKKSAKPAWRIRRHGGDREKFYIHAADSRADARRRFGQYTKWGLAKKSWGWFMKSLFNRAAPTDNPKAVVRPDMVEGSLREIVTGDNPRVEVHITNKLDYITAAMQPNAVEDAMKQATIQINAQIDKGISKAREDLGK